MSLQDIERRERMRIDLQNNLDLEDNSKFQRPLSYLKIYNSSVTPISKGILSGFRTSFRNSAKRRPYVIDGMQDHHNLLNSKM